MITLPGSSRRSPAGVPLSPEPLTAARVGCVRYLNSKPLIHGHADEVSFETPADLADGLRTGRLAVALAPVFELIAHPGYLVVDDVAIASDGPVYSVYVAYQGELSDLRTLYVHGESRSSANLQRVLLAEFHGIRPQNVPFPGGVVPEALRPGEGALIIGDPAIAYRLRRGDRCRYLDLGEAWHRATGLPFVFAAWLVRPDVSEPEALGEKLRGWRAGGQASLLEIAAAETRFPGDVTRRYLQHHIRYRLGAREKRALAEYARLLHKHGMVGGGSYEDPRWV